MAHITNLAVQDYLKGFGSATKDIEDSNDDDDVNMDTDGDRELEEHLPVIPKLQKLITMVHFSSQRREMFETQCRAYHLKQFWMYVLIGTQYMI